MAIVEELNHSFWKNVLRLDSYERCYYSIEKSLADGKLVPIRIELDDPDHKTVQLNDLAIRERWPEIWSRIQNRTRDCNTADSGEFSES